MLDYADASDDRSQSDFSVLSSQIWEAWADKGRDSILKRKDMLYKQSLVLSEVSNVTKVVTMINDENVE